MLAEVGKLFRHNFIPAIAGNEQKAQIAGKSQRRTILSHIK